MKPTPSPSASASTARRGTIRVVAVCPCGYNLNYVTLEDVGQYADALVGYDDDGEAVLACDSCGARFRVRRETITDAQHECLRLLDEA